MPSLSIACNAPTDEEMADELNVSVSELHDSLLAISHSSMASS